jgi:hypothetical protein
MDMEVDRLQMQIDTQQKMLEAQKSIRDTHNNKTSMEEKQTKLNIQNIQKLENQRLLDTSYYPRIESIEERDNEYVFTIMVDSGTALQPNRKVVWLERNKSFTTDGGVNFYTLWAGDENFDSVSSMCISNLDCFKEKLVDMVGVVELSESGGDSAKLQQISNLLNSI